MRKREKKWEKQLLEGGVFFCFFLEEREHKRKWGEPKTKWRIKILKKKKKPREGRNKGGEKKRGKEERISKEFDVDRTIKSVLIDLKF